MPCSPQRVRCVRERARDAIVRERERDPYSSRFLRRGKFSADSPRDDVALCAQFYRRWTSSLPRDFSRESLIIANRICVPECPRDEMRFRDGYTHRAAHRKRGNFKFGQPRRSCFLVSILPCVEMFLVQAGITRIHEETHVAVGKKGIRTLAIWIWIFQTIHLNELMTGLRAVSERAQSTTASPPTGISSGRRSFFFFFFRPVYH